MEDNVKKNLYILKYMYVYMNHLAIHLKLTHRKISIKYFKTVKSLKTEKSQKGVMLPELNLSIE